MPPIIASVGELLVEFICDTKGGHHLAPARYLGPFPSGAPGIFIDQAARMGVGAIFAGAVGDDAFGQVVRSRLVADGVDDRLILTVPGQVTGSAFVSYNHDGSREFVFNIARSAAAHFPDGEGAAQAMLAAGVSLIHVSGSALGDVGMRGRIVDLVGRLTAQGVALSFDPNIRPEVMRDAGYLATVRDLVAEAALVLPSDDDADLLFPGEEFAIYAHRLIAGGAKAVVLKRGAAGCIGMGRDLVATDLAGHRVTVVDPTGAGDCFCATFAALHVMGMALPDALRRANAAGALAVGRLGPMEGNSSPAEIDAFLAGAG